ncbi:Uncharacterised protein [Mycobacterium tuberculosis]|nr:Uncharacterised protein [Mycobacterium tuberculosis]
MPVQADILMPAMIPTGSPLSVTAVGWTLNRPGESGDSLI